MIVNFAVFFFFGWASLLALGLVLFRFKLRAYWVQIILASILLDYISVLLQIHHKIFLITTIQPISAILCYWLIFRIHWFYAIIITVSSYLINFSLEAVFNFASAKFQMNDFLVALQSSDIAIAVLIIFIDLFICAIVIKYRLGFTFIPNHTIRPTAFLQKNKRMMLTFFFTLIILMLSSFSIFYFHSHIAMLLQVLVVVLWFVVIREAYHKEAME
ncbi:hypothetical protein SAMN03159341_104249 [Paenibacillus sp. 1_12]|uniref:hypothetical protein n=1 Tax=Paenibacillus sp. 1_12 TaxID=1566278 RepID=UPI0008E87B04|nr:hypothetical protein [Paenibacillus sp. 1_12]SFL24995.1 hypothetical protein SAMN03159341_104249 [Paenibacillus sp. 1_12]